MKTAVVASCAFCRREFTLVQFLKLPFTPASLQAGRDWSDLPGGALFVVRDCDCRPVGARNSVAVLVEADGTVRGEV